MKNLVQTYEDNDGSTVAYVSKTYNTTTKHIINWTMRYNKKAMEPRSQAKNNGTSTHEFGHTIGLADLKNSGNINKLMYGYSNRTAGSPTSSDITGAKEAVK